LSKKGHRLVVPYEIAGPTTVPLESFVKDKQKKPQFPWETTAGGKDKLRPARALSTAWCYESGGQGQARGSKGEDLRGLLEKMLEEGSGSCEAGTRRGGKRKVQTCYKRPENLPRRGNRGEEDTL